MRDGSSLSADISAGNVSANAVSKEAAGCAKSVGEDCGKDEGEKGDGQANHADPTFEGKSDAHSEPCRQANRSGIIGGPGVIRVGQKTER